MPSLFLRKGLLADLDKATHTPGTLSFITDERAIYLDLEDNSRVRFGGFVQVANAKELNNNKYRPYSTGILYYISDVKGLYAFNGKKFQLINDYSTEFSNINTAIQAVEDLIKGVEVELDNVNASIAMVADNKQDTVVGAATSIVNENLDANKILISTAEGKVGVSTIDATQLLYLNGVTSELQVQITNLDTNLKFETDQARAEEKRLYDQSVTDNEALYNKITSEYEAYVETTLGNADAMKFMGVAHNANDLGVVGNDKGLPVAAGWTYKVGTQFGNYKVGDLLIASKDQEGNSYEFGWSHVESGYEDNYDPALVGNAANKSVTLLSGVDADLGKIVFADNYTEATGGIKSTVSVSGGVTTIKTEMLWGSF